MADMRHGFECESVMSYKNKNDVSKFAKYNDVPYTNTCTFYIEWKKIYEII